MDYLIHPSAVAACARCGLNTERTERHQYLLTLDGRPVATYAIATYVGTYNPPRLLEGHALACSLSRASNVLSRLRAEIAGCWHSPQERQRVATDGQRVVSIGDLRATGTGVRLAEGLLLAVETGNMSVPQALEEARQNPALRIDRSGGNYVWKAMTRQASKCIGRPGTWEQQNLPDMPARR